MRKTSRYYCSSCTLIFSLEEDYDDACPHCSEFQLELIDQDNEAQGSLNLWPSKNPNDQQEQS